MFLADVMLSKLGRWLRIFGIRTEIVKEEKESDDTTILFAAKEKNLVLLTMDQDMAERAKRLGIKVLHIPHSHPMEKQIATVLKTYSIPIEGFEERTLCTKCGGELETVASDQVGGIPEDVKKRFKEIWKCKECGQPYWEGSHWRKINEMVERVKKCM